MIVVRSALFFMIYSVTAILFSCLAVLLWPLPFRWRYPVVSRWAVWNIWLLRVICGIKLQLEGTENIPDEPCVILCNHQSAWETLALQMVFPPQVWVLKRELLWLPFFGWGLASLRPIAIDRNAGRKALSQVIEQGIQRLNTGIWVVIFPEGTRMPVNQTGRFGIGGARLAVEAGVPVVPVAHNAGHYWPKRGFLKTPGTITLRVGAKIAPADYSPGQLNQLAEAWIVNAMTELENTHQSDPAASGMRS